MAYIEFKNVDKIYKMGEVEIKALKDTTFEIEKGELVCILGPSGAGKTTCLNILGGMDTLTNGKVIVDGVRIDKLKEIEDNGTNIPVEENIDVLFTATSENELETASYLMQNLRLNGFITEIGDKLSAKFNILLKDKDLEHNEVIIKDNVTGEETKSNINDIAEYLEMNI